MTGWRVGYAVGDPEIISAMSKLTGQTTSNLTSVSQYAAIEALTGPQDSVEIMRQAFEERLNTIYPLLCEVPGFEVVKPQGAFYLFPNVKKAMEMKGYSDVTAFTTAILEEVGLALITGAGFGAPENVRLSYATDLDTLKEAVERLKAFMENKKKRKTMTKRVTIIDVKDYVGQEVTIGAWVANKSGKGKIAFLQLRDGTAFFQGVAFKPNFVEKFGEEVGLRVDVIKRLSQETSVYVTGIVKEDERSKFGYELDITDIEVIGESQDYPITPKEHGTDFLMDNRHLWLRSRKQVAVMQIRNAIIYATYEFFDKNGFMKFDSPILSGNAAEDSTELFETDYFGTPAYLSQSGQLYLGSGCDGSWSCL